MDLWQLHIFVQVVENESFSRAAEACHLSQPTVSTHIKDLEEHFGCRLIDRLGKTCAPTKGGEILYRFARKMLALRDEAQAALSAYLGEPSGKLVIGGSTIPGGYVLPKVIGEFARQYPKVTVSLLIGDTRTIATHTLEGSMELGVVGAKIPDRKLVQEKLLEDDIRLVMRAGHPLADRKEISLEDLAGEPFILRETGSGTRRVLEELLAETGKGLSDLRVVAEMGSTEAVREGIKAGIGVSVLSTRAVAGELSDGSLKALTIQGLSLTRSFFVIRHRSRTPSPLCDAFFLFLKESLSFPETTKNGT